MAAELGVSESRIGLLVTVFAGTVVLTSHEPSCRIRLSNAVAVGVEGR
jgi:hypothetical protein